MADGTYVMPFGKYRGKQVADCPRDYLNWLQEQDWMLEKRNHELLEAVECECALRDRSYDDY